MDATVSVTVELFGTARMACGRRVVEVEMPAKSSGAILAAALASACPELVGVAVREDMGGLLESYTLNLNGKEFVGSGQIVLSEGDTVLLFSSQAGG